MRVIHLCCFVFFVCAIFSVLSSEICETVTKYGIVEGKFMTSRNGKIFCAFLAIPYAAPPINELRFLPPTQPHHWEGVRDATKESDVCLQIGDLGSEDCLYLNIFTHNTTALRPSPVMVYIHGGGFFGGSSSLSFHGPEYFMDRNVVLVTLQYRLGVFGFLSTGDEVISGNMGLKDQVKALEYVQDNINSFGGDPKKVTLFGNSAGGSSVHFHMLSPVSQNLFAQGISQSGTSLSGFAIIGKNLCRKITKNMAQSLNCSTFNSNSIYKCIKNKNSTDILNSYERELNSRYDFSKILFRPIIEPESDHAFITKNPKNIKTNKPWMVGINANEGIFRLKNRNLNDTINKVKSSFNKIASQFMLFEYLWNITDESANKIKEFYFNNDSSTNDIRAMEQITTDSWFLWPTEQAIKNHQGPVYYYLYDHQADYSFSDFYGAPKGYGVSHVDELITLFTQTALFSKLNEQDTNISKVIVNMWVNFATEGNPTPNPISSDPQKDSFRNFTWTQLNNNISNYIHIKTSKLSMKNQIFPKRMNFWKHLPLNENY